MNNNSSSIILLVEYRLAEKGVPYDDALEKADKAEMQSGKSR